MSRRRMLAGQRARLISSKWQTYLGWPGCLDNDDRRFASADCVHLSDIQLQLAEYENASSSKNDCPYYLLCLRPHKAEALSDAFV